MAPDPSSDRTTCEIRNWRVFSPGTFKESGEYFSPADTAKIGRNFAQYSTGDNPQLQPLIKIGHHRGQRYAKSLGFPSLGKIVAAHTEPDGVFVVDRAVGIPRIVGSAINSGFLPSGSVELPPKGAWRPTTDPNADIDGDVLSGIALLGEELPGVPGFPPPKAVFADGTPVPPLTDEEQVWWLEHMAAIAGNEPEREKPSQTDTEANYSSGTRSLCFSALTFSAAPVESVSMDAASIVAALQADPALLEQVLAMAQSGAPEPAPVAEAVPVPAVAMSGAAQAGDGTPGAGDSDFSSKFAAFSADMKKCMGAMETRMSAIEAYESGKKEKEKETEMSAFSAMVDTAWKEANADQKIPPVVAKSVKSQGLAILGDKTFASTDLKNAAFGEWKAGLAAMPVNPMLKNAVQDTAQKGDGLKQLAQANPQLMGMLKGGNLLRAFPESFPKIAEKFGVAVA